MQEYPVAQDQFDIQFYQVVEMFSEQKLDVSALDQDLRVLGLNSISFIKLIIALENEFNIEMEDEYLELENFTTLQHLKDSLRMCLNFEVSNESMRRS
ncbi:phosphopantetheine-binding protein [Paenibacillus polysaccharolyticus]|uniref:phosphopantetheine-binding protein n=1 Tax=Paenibacillus polysaccharolyticus TaxID=582692 RepID=UPI00203A62DF|nr:phosphopantetheine-binding protein [Paenibacillus polysaccharolyticus]MCM3133485.1 phosphopantetheine-binding protein [Paenibacillus polysaccharolyticus]